MDTSKQNLSFDDLPRAVNLLISEVSELRNSLIQPKETLKEDVEFLTYEETMKKLKASRTTIWKYAKEGKLTPLGSGKRRFFSKADVLAFIEGKKKEY